MNINPPGTSQKQLLETLWRLSPNRLCEYTYDEISKFTDPPRSKFVVSKVLCMLRDEGAIKAEHVLHSNSPKWRLVVRPDDYRFVKKDVSKYDWTAERLAAIRPLWLAGDTTPVILKKLGLPPEAKNALIGKIHRMGLPSRPSPIRGYVRPSRPVVPKVTVPKLRSEVTPPPAVSVGWKADIKQAAARKVALFALAARDTSGHISPFDNVTYRPVRPAIVQPYVSPVAKCVFPLWGDGRPTHRYCDAPVDRKSYCKTHADLCYNKLRDLREPVAA